MRRTILAVALVSIPLSLGAADPQADFRYNGNGYVFFSAGSCQHRYFNVGVGGGGEAFLWRGLALGVDAGYYRFPADRNVGYGVLTLNPGYHFVNRKKPMKFDPYVSGTVLGIAFAPGAIAPAGGLGFGVNYWFKERMGLQTGVQAQGVDGEALIVFRIGLTFR